MSNYFDPPDQFEDDYYDTRSPEQVIMDKMTKIENAANKSIIDEFEYRDISETIKTMDLKFIDGKLHQRVETSVTRYEVNTGNSILISTESIWALVPSE